MSIVIHDMTEDKTLDRKAMAAVTGGGFNEFVSSIDNALGNPRTPKDFLTLYVNAQTEPLRIALAFANVDLPRL